MSDKEYSELEDEFRMALQIEAERFQSVSLFHILCYSVPLIVVDCKLLVDVQVNDSYYIYLC